jgi:hypothetical protein
VCAAVSGLTKVGVSGAAVLGLVDRDFYSDQALAHVPPGVVVLRVHEIESVLCDRRVVEALATHLGKDPEAIWSAFLSCVQKTFNGQTLSSVVARRVRARVNDLLDGAFAGSQVMTTVSETRDKHRSDLDALALPAKVDSMFAEEEERVIRALSLGDVQMLALLPGKHLVKLLAAELGFEGYSDLNELVIAALNRRHLNQGNALRELGEHLERALLAFLPPRRVL